MTDTAIDTNALLAILYEDSFADASEQAIRDAYRKGRLLISPVVYAELAADDQFADRAGVDEFLADFSIGLEHPSKDALFVAGERFHRYLERRPDGHQCPSCGAERQVRCNDCGAELAARQHLAADFLIGGQAETDADHLISFDSAFYDTYFPELAVQPDETSAN